MSMVESEKPPLEIILMTEKRDDDQILAQMRGEVAVDHHIHLHGAGCDDSRAHQEENSPDPVVAPGKVRPEMIANPAQCGELHAQLE